MKRCTTIPYNSCARGLAQPTRRWVSHDRSTLTDEALLDKVRAPLAGSKYGANITVKADSKTIETPAGELPMSPVFNPVWIKSRRRPGKADPQPVKGQFRKRLQSNIFACVLDSPVRFCPITRTHQPRSFLQEYDVVWHPETLKSWAVPYVRDLQKTHGLHGRDASPEAEPTTTDRVNKLHEGDTSPETEPTTTDQVNELRESNASLEAESTTMDRVNELHEGDAYPDAESMILDAMQDHSPKLRAYTVSQKSIVDDIGDERNRLQGVLMAHRNGMSMNPDAKLPVWRHDMGDVLLASLRREVVLALLYRAAEKESMLQPCQAPEMIADVERRGCVLWLPKAPDTTVGEQYAIFEVPGAKYGATLPVHNLRWMLGEEALAQLRAESAIFRDNELFVLKMGGEQRVKQLHMLLWRLQGYLDVPVP